MNISLWSSRFASRYGISLHSISKIVLVLLLCVTTYLSYNMHTTIKKSAEAHFNLVVDEAITDLKRQMKLYECLLHSAEGLHYGSDFVTQKEWKIFADNVHLSRNYLGMQGFGFSLYIPKNELSKHISKHTKENPKYEFKPLGDREEYSPIVYLEPQDLRNKKAIGFDMLSEPRRNEAMKRAIDTGEPQMTRSVILAQETNMAPQQGFLIYLPVYKKFNPSQTVQERRQNIYGFVYSPFPINDFVDAIFDRKNKGIEFKIFDTRLNGHNAQLMYDGVSKNLAEHVENPMFTDTKEITFYGQTWTIFFQSQRSFEQNIDINKPLFMFLSGFIISFLLFFAARALMLMREKSHKIAKQMTIEYINANRELEVKVQELDRLNEHLNETVASEVQIHLLANYKSTVQKAHLAAIIDSSQDAIISKDINGVILSWNEGAHTLFGYTDDEMIGQKMNILYPPAFLEEEDILLHVIRQGRQLKQFESHRIKKDGQKIIVLVSSSPMFDKDGQVFGVSSIIRDITEKKKWEEDLKNAQQQALAASRAKSDFLTNMSHEIRTPMNAILGMSHLLMDADIPAKLKGYVTTVMTSSNTLLSLINDILDFSKIEAGKMELEEARFCLDELLDEIEQIFSARIHEKNLGFFFLIDESVPTYIIGDKLRLKQIIMNLLNNALKFTYKGSISVKVSNLTPNQTNATLEFGIQDSGIGMTNEQMSRLFQPFEQADTSTTRLYGGSGLGLAICKKLVEKMGGTMGVESQVDKGSYFFAKIPFICIDELPELFKKAKDKLAQKHFLLIDNHEEYAQKLLNLLGSFGVIVEYYTLGACLKQTIKNDNAYDVVMVGFDEDQDEGVQVLQKLIDTKAVESKNIILSSSYTIDMTVLPAQENSIANIIKKSISRSALLDILLSTIDQEHCSQFVISEQQKITTASKSILLDVRILVVDDNHINLEMMDELLGSYSATVVTASSGEEALEILSKREQSFDIILMDLNMPYMDGFETVEHIRSRGFDNIAILALSADVTKRTIKKTNSLQFDGYLSKPVNPDELVDAIVKHTNANVGIKECGEMGKAKNIEFDFTSIDSVKGLRMVAGNSTMYIRILKKFANNYGDSFEKFQNFIATSQINDAKQLLHTLKGTSGNLGMVKLHDILSRVERVIDKRIGDDLLHEFARELKNCMGEISSIIEEPAKDKNTQGDKQVTKEQVTKLLDKVASFQIAGREDAEEIYNSLADECIHKKSFKKLVDLLGEYDFLAAKSILEDISNQLESGE